MVYVVGVGPGDYDFMIHRMDEIIYKADVVIGGRRHLDYIESRYDLTGKEKIYIVGNLNNIRDYIIQNKEKTISVLASGDPSLYGIGEYIIKNLSEYVDISIVPGISSIQYCFSKFNISMNDVYLTSSHGRELNYDFVFAHDKVAMVTDKRNGPREVALEIENRGLDYNFFVGENLSYEDERLLRGNYRDFLEEKEYKMCVLIIQKNNI